MGVKSRPGDGNDSTCGSAVPAGGTVLAVQCGEAAPYPRSRPQHCTDGGAVRAQAVLVWREEY